MFIVILLDIFPLLIKNVKGSQSKVNCSNCDRDDLVMFEKYEIKCRFVCGDFNVKQLYHMY